MSDLWWLESRGVVTAECVGGPLDGMVVEAQEPDGWAEMAPTHPHILPLPDREPFRVECGRVVSGRRWARYLWLFRSKSRSEPRRWALIFDRTL